MIPSDVKTLLINAGFPIDRIIFPLAQASFECGNIGFTSPAGQANNNLTGIIWADASYQHNATKGTPKPSNEAPGFYAHFETLEDWAKDFRRIVHAQFCKANGFYADWNLEGRPIDADDLEAYVRRLKLNHYFEGDESIYLNGMNEMILKLNDWFNNNQPA